MALKQDIETEINKAFKTAWTRREGKKVPDTDGLALGNDALTLDAAVLYADLAESTKLVDAYKDEFAAEIYKTYLLSACKIVKDNGGEITAFDGDRIMAVFVGDVKNTSAVKTALKINYTVQKIINPAIKTAYPTTTFQIQQSVGVDSGQLLVARTGIRGSNDLVWVGRAANYAAKLCGLRDGPFSSFITEEVFKKTNADTKHGGNPRQPMWEKVIWQEMNIPIYRSSWTWSI